MQHPTFRMRAWVKRLFLRQCAAWGASLLLLMCFVDQVAWQSYALGGISYLLAYGVFIFCCFFWAEVGDAKHVLRAFYWGEGLKFMTLGFSVYLILRFLPLQMLFFLLAWVMLHVMHVWGVLYNDLPREQN